MEHICITIRGARQHTGALRRFGCVISESMDSRRLQAWWWKKQGLDGSLEDHPPAEVLERSGWARSVGGAGPYLTLFARAGTSRTAADTAVAKLEIHELPSARGCTYVLPASDFALGLKVGQTPGLADMKVAARLGVTDKEIDKLGAAVIAALEKGPMDPEELRRAVGGAVRSLGPEGQKKGLSSTLPLALGRLQSEGEIRRVPVNGRLDQQRYKYARWSPNPLEGFKLTLEEAYTELARRFFRWIGPATVAEFQWFSGLSGNAAKAAVAPLKLEALDDEWLIAPEERDAFEHCEPAADPQYALVSSLDAISALRRDVRGLLGERDVALEVFGTKTGFLDLPNHAILDRGRIVGLWDYDPATEAVVWWSFAGGNEAMKQAVARTEKFVREDLGDARAFSLDSPKSRAGRIEALRRSGK
ncbi:MAG TPA: crosslink repair DNA glycosylase YcaQ family protein [Bryobacteraceae bacterium]|nr:crosslink repair DNA glycosylase YcaQ family protein [Bryobacteraceae bacterium]